MSAPVPDADFTAEGIQALRRELVVLRDAALDQKAMNFAVVLSHTIAVLWDYREKIHGISTE